jgi:hypothetical protein
MALKIGLLVVLVVVAFLAYAATRPNEFRMQRSVLIEAGAEKIFPHINDFHQWSAWSPFEKLDPEMKKSFSGAPSGPGAVYEWDGNKKAGKGRMEITAAAAPTQVVLKLDFMKPFEGHNITTFTMTPTAGITDVTWAMSGPSPFPMKVMHVVINMDRMIGKDFDAGLANLKAIVEVQT